MTDFDAHFTPKKLIRTPGVLVILFESCHSWRQIFTDGRPLPERREPAWFGYSAGKWEGNRLVVDTVGLNEKAWLDDIGHPHSDALRIIERFRRPDFGHMMVDVTIDDPDLRQALGRFDSLGLCGRTELLDWVCENHKDPRHMVGK